MISTVTGAPLPASADLAELLDRQITAPVLFAQAVELAAKDADLFIEVGAGRVLTGLAGASVDVPVVPLDTDADSLRRRAGGRRRRLRARRRTGTDTAVRRPADPTGTHRRRPKVFANPCEPVGRGAASRPPSTRAAPTRD